MKFVIVFIFVVLVVVSAAPLNQDDILSDEDENVYSNDLIPLSRVRRQEGDYIKAGAAYSTHYGAGGQIVANKNLARGKHYSIDAQAKYNQFGRHKEGWSGVNYSFSW